MKIVCISDTHNRKPQSGVPDGDILIVAGDFSLQGAFSEVANFNKWLGTLPHKHKIVIAGNHDLSFESNPTIVRPLLTNATYLQDSEVTVEGLRIYGSPWQPEFCDWAFNLPRGEKLREKWDQIPEGIDILVTHGPPKGIRDKNFYGEECGCEELMAAVLRIRPQLHVFGHIHEGYGVTHLDGITFVNAATCTDHYIPSNDPIVIDL